MDMQWLGWLMLVGYAAWSLYMATFRTEDYRKMQEDSWRRGTTVLKGGFRVGTFLLRTFGPRITKR